MFNKTIQLLFSTALVSLSFNAAAFADTIDEQQKSLQSELAVAKSSNTITSSQANELDKGMKDFNKLKRQLRDSRNGVLTLEDDEKLNKSLNEVQQKFEQMKKAKAK